MLKVIPVLCLALAVSCGRVAQASEPGATLLALEGTWLHAILARDLEALKKILSEDYVDINYKGVVRTKADALAAPNVSGPPQTLSEEKVRIYGKTAVLTGRGSMAVAGAERHWRFTDVFVLRGQSWQAVSSQETPETTP